MKYVDGIFNIVVGGILLMFPPVSDIDLWEMRMINVLGSIDNVKDNIIDIPNRGGERVLYTYSTPIMIVGALFILYGAYKIWRVKHESNQQSH